MSGSPALPAPDSDVPMRDCCPRRARIDRIPLDEGHRTILCAVWDVLTESEAPSTELPIESVLTKLKTAGIKTDDFAKIREELAGWNLLDAFGSKLRPGMEAMRLRLLHDGVHAGVGSKRPEQTVKVIGIANMILHWFDRLSCAQESLKVRREDVLAAARPDLADVEESTVRAAIHWLVHSGIVEERIVNAGTPTWWMQTGGLPRPPNQSIEQEPTRSQVFVSFDIPDHKVRTFLEGVKQWRETEEAYKAEILARLEHVLELAERDKNDPLKDALFEALGKIPILSSLIDILRVLDMLLEKYPQLRREVVPPKLLPAFEADGIVAITRFQ